MEIRINNTKYKVKVAKSEEDKRKGLLNIEELPKSEGMLFIYDEPLSVKFWMKDTKIPLDIVFINEDEEVISVKQGEPLSEELITEDTVLYVLEVNLGSGINKGDDVEFPSEESEDGMKVLAPDGSVQFQLKGGERIFSRPNTLMLIKLAKRAYLSHEDKDFLKLGKMAFKYLKILDNNDPEYVELKN